MNIPTAEEFASGQLPTLKGSGNPEGTKVINPLYEQFKLESSN